MPVYVRGGASWEAVIRCRRREGGGMGRRDGRYALRARERAQSLSGLFLTTIEAALLRSRERGKAQER